MNYMRYGYNSPETKVLPLLLTERRLDAAGKLIVSTFLVSSEVNICHSVVSPRARLI